MRISRSASITPKQSSIKTILSRCTMARSWSQRAILYLTAVTAIPLAGCSALSFGENSKPLTEHHGNHPIAYSHDQLRLTGPERTVALGDGAEFTITNTATASVALGCHSPWTLQQRADGRWRDAIWTSARGIPIVRPCFRLASPESNRSR